jgi:hypothetical protein
LNTLESLPTSAKYVLKMNNNVTPIFPYLTIGYGSLLMRSSSLMIDPYCEVVRCELAYCS